ncbi:MAG TPA: ABC transporter ATP-binding protein [Chloroflexi bacterium]|jgi:peptide/nickel transport system ATP-binding protein|nr:ABC transporter ATP-binding protein [Chloroflexota bacterium]HPO57728.1 ABC transporter ATP-binding protein [Anaerolineaceae bacterium]
MAKLLEIQDLQVRFFTPEGVVRAVEGVTLHINEGETLAVVGESGCGKSVTARSIMRLIPNPPGKVTGGSIRFNGKDVLALEGDELRQLRGGDVAMIFQEPMTSLNPVFTIKDQLTEAIILHQKVSREEAVNRAARLLELTGIPSARERLECYPHQLSGGMRQRVMIAMAISCNPKLLIADEPTTALDVTIQAQILQVMRDLKEEFGMAIMLITHDLGVVAEMAERVAVMYAGHIVETRSVTDLFNDPQHPYTEGLLNSIPSVETVVERLHVIEGNVPNLLDLPSGCAFRDRCPYALDRCAEEMPRLTEVRPGLEVACFNYRDLREQRALAEAAVRVPAQAREAVPQNEREPLVKVDRLVKHFVADKGFLGRGKKYVHAVDDVSFEIYEGETFGLVGESGCGKTTTGRIIVGLEQRTSGDVIIMGKSMYGRTPAEQQQLRKDVQIIFQDPYSSLNPRMPVSTIIGEGLRIHEHLSAKEKEKRVLEIMRQVGLEDYHMERYPHEFSGGQRQRIGIARALILDPRFIVCDEPVSALDVSIQAQILNLLRDLQQTRNLTYLFIAHNLGVVKHISDRIGVLYMGQLLEVATKEELYSHPLHPYTQALLSAAPRPHPERKSQRILLEGDIPSPINPPSGCRFRTRCRYASPDCAERPYQLRDVGAGHMVACGRV